MQTPTRAAVPPTGAEDEFPVGPEPEEGPVSAQQFVALTAHEMQVPISVLGWNLDRLQRLLGDVEGRRDVERVLERLVEANLRLTTLVEDLLNLSRLATGAFQVHPRPAQVAEVVRRCLRALDHESERRGVKLDWSWDPDVPLILADPKRLYEVVMNIVNNALKYTPRGGRVTVAIRRTKEMAPATVLLPKGTKRTGDFVLVAVRDTGIGIPKEEQPKVFRQFFRGRRALATAEGGTGLGLYLVRKIVEQHGGVVWFTSREGYGTTFFFTTPVAAPYEPPKRGGVAAAPTGETPPVRHPRRTTRSSSPRTIMLTEDDA